MTAPLGETVANAVNPSLPFEPTRPEPPPQAEQPARTAPAPSAGLRPAAGQPAAARPDAVAQAALRRAAAAARAPQGPSSPSGPAGAGRAAEPMARSANAFVVARSANASVGAPSADTSAVGPIANAPAVAPPALQVQQKAARRAPPTAARTAPPEPTRPLASADAATSAGPISGPGALLRPAAAPPALQAQAAAVPAGAGRNQALQTPEDTAWVQAALRLLQFEQDIRGLPDVTALQMHLVNDAQAVLGFDQAIVWRRHRGTGRLRPVMASGLPTVDREAPVMRALTRVLRRLQRGRQLEAALKLDLHNRERLPRLRPADRQALAGFSLRHGLWYPMADRDGSYHAGVLFLNHQAFAAGAPRLMGRLVATYAHAWRALGQATTLAEGRRWPWLAAALSVPLLVGAALMPVRLSVMAPVEVVAAAPMVVTAPISGVVRQILVAPSAAVTAGMPLLQFDDVQPRNEMLLAQQRLAVAQARDARTAAAAFTDPNAAHDLATAQAELQLARVNFNYAAEVLQRTQVLASQAGVAVYSDRRDWEGRAVQVGEEILQVADPQRVAYKVALSAGNSIALKPGADVDVYLADAPLGGLPAKLRSVSYTPQPQSGGEASYVVLADAAGGALPRIGARGTARLYGETVPLGVQLLRRPLAAWRQWVGL